MTKDIRNIAVLGSTGSIGRQTLDIIAEYPQLFKAWLLVARSSADLLIQQARQCRPHMVIIADEQYYEYVRDALEDTGIEVATGSAAIAQAVTAPEIDTVVTAMVGYSGLESTIAAIRAGKRVVAMCAPATEGQFGKDIGMASIRAALKYLFYSIAGAFLALLAIFTVAA